jgi:hypothetical protein
MNEAWDYIKRNNIAFFVCLFIVAFAIDMFAGISVLRYLVIALYAFGYYLDSQHGRTNIAERKQLSQQGLSREELQDARFIEKWRETREAGRTKYVFIYGGMYLGFGLCFLFSIAAMAYIGNTVRFLQESPGNMFSLIGYGYAAGFITASALYRILWSSNEKKFGRLTDAGH